MEERFIPFGDSAKGFSFLGAYGQPVILGNGDRVAKVRECMEDLQLAIDGYLVRVQHLAMHPGSELLVSQVARALSAFARTCSVFLRKMVLGEQGRQDTRLLTDDLCREAGLSFPRIRGIRGDRKSLTVEEFELTDGKLQATLEGTDFPATFAVSRPLQPLHYQVVVEWPLPGMAGWTKQPTPERLWRIHPEELFESQETQQLGCNQWLGQQLVLVNGWSVSLQDMIRTTANTEGAHTSPSIPLHYFEGQGRPRALKNSHVHIASQLTIASVRYNHIVMCETALFLYIALLQNQFFTPAENKAPVTVRVPGLALALRFPVFSEPGQWLGLDAAVMMGFGSDKRVEKYEIRAPRAK